jgi:PAS domain S-box-containing protein
MAGPLRVLIVEDSEDDAALILRELRRGGLDVQSRRLESPQAMTAALKDASWDAVISDYALPSFDAPAALATLKQAGIDIPFIIVSGTIGEETAVAAMKAGAHDYLMKSNLARLVPAVERELREAASRRERRAAEEALRQSEERYRSFFEKDLTCDFIATVDGHILDCNPAFLRTFGLTSLDEARRANMAELFPEPAARARFLSQLQAQHELMYFEQELRHRDGAPVFVVENAVGIFDEHGKLTRVQGYLFDITAHKKTEEQLRQAQKMEAVGRLAGGVAHDFNNILQVMLGTIEMLKVRQDHDPKVASSADELSHLVGRATALTRQLLLFARRGVTKPEKLELNELIGSAAAMLSRLVRANVHFTVTPTDEPLPITGDAGQLEQVLMNLVVNAVDAMPEGGELEIRTGGGDDLVWFEVADTGAGIPPDIREKIFEPFFTTKGADRGTGLGLSVVHGIVTQHGGSIAVTSDPGRGATFRVELPSSDPRAFEPVRQVKATKRSGEGERVLVVEDDPAVREALGALLAWLGYDATLVEDAEELSRFPESQPFDLLITDFMLPGMSGIEVSETLRKRWPALRVIVMSGYAESEVLRQEIGEGTVRFLQKPIDLSTLSRAVRAALDAP